MVIMENEDSAPLYELRFDAAVKVIQSLPPDGSFQPSNDMMLKFYSYYKQATLGPCNTTRPGFWDPVGKVKWDAWNDLGDMTKEESMTAYVEEMKKILEGMPCTDEVEQLLKVLGPFYEQVEENKKINQVSDLSAGFGGMLSSVPSKSVTKSITRTMEMNCSPETQHPRQDVDSANPKVSEREKHREEEEFRIYEEEDMGEDEEPFETKELKNASTPKPKKKLSTGRPQLNGSLGNGLGHLSNGTLSSKSSLNSEEPGEGHTNYPLSLDPHAQLNGHMTDTDGPDPQNVANDSDSEVYCDSMDQFGLDEGSVSHTDRCLELDEEEQGEERENHSPLFDQDGPAEAPCRTPNDPQGSPRGIQCGGEDGETGGESQRQRLNGSGTRSSVVRTGLGSRSSGHSPGVPGPLQNSGGDGERWREAGVPGGSLNEHIIVALARLQEDMQSVLERLHTLEALTASQQTKSLSSPYPSSPLAQKRRKTPTWWPFEISPGTVAFAVLWPFVVQWLIRQFLQRRRRRIN
ncbi:hypothetical protein DPEC_G00079390 [Dallia pectoralis]|uniref:Uncharacterized protein n=1 Tax=Dallia pectoralis TaxID=75939 RepID=A0ACC2H4Q3_DALPE|nr:hypothetical protein DPEC_G00079390 [Dallia pectoralis]